MENIQINTESVLTLGFKKVNLIFQREIVIIGIILILSLLMGGLLILGLTSNSLEGFGVLLLLLAIGPMLSLISFVVGLFILFISLVSMFKISAIKNSVKNSISTEESSSDLYKKFLKKANTAYIVSILVIVILLAISVLLVN